MLLLCMCRTQNLFLGCCASYKWHICKQDRQRNTISSHKLRSSISRSAASASGYCGCQSHTCSCFLPPVCVVLLVLLPQQEHRGAKHGYGFEQCWAMKHGTYVEPFSYQGSVCGCTACCTPSPRVALPSWLLWPQTRGMISSAPARPSAKPCLKCKQPAILMGRFRHSRNILCCRFACIKMRSIFPLHLCLVCDISCLKFSKLTIQICKST